MEPIEQVNEDVWPISVREALNDVIYRINRPWLVQFEDVPSPKVVQGDDRVVIVLPRFLSAAFATRNDFSCYDAGSGKLGIDNGNVQNILPVGMVGGATRGSVNAYKVTVSTGTGEAYLIVAYDVDTNAITSVTLGHASTTPDDTPGTAYKMLCDFEKLSGGAITIGGGKQGIGSQNFFACAATGYFWGND